MPTADRVHSNGAVPYTVRTAAWDCAPLLTTVLTPGREGHYSHLAAVPRPIAVRNGAGIEPSVDRRAEASAESGAGAALVCA